RRRRGSRPGARVGPARGGRPAVGVRRHHGGRQPSGRSDPDHPGGAVRVVLAEDLALLRDGLVRLLSAYGCEFVAAVEDADALEVALRDPTVDVAVVDVRLPPGFTDEGLRAAIAARARRPGLPVMVL